MALVPYTVTALAESDADGTDGKNIVVGAVVSVNDINGNVATMYDDETGANPSTAKATGANGQVVIYVEEGEYELSTNGTVSRINTGKNIIPTTSDLINTTRGYQVGDVVSTCGYSSSGDGGEGKWIKTNSTSTPSQSPSDTLDATLTDGNGNVWSFVGDDNTVSLLQLGATYQTDSTNIINAAHNSPFGTISTGGNDDYFEFSTITIDSSKKMIGSGELRGLSTTGTKPTALELQGAADNAARLALLDAYYTSSITVSGSSSLSGECKITSALFLSNNITVSGSYDFSECAFYDSQIIADRNGVVSGSGITCTSTDDTAGIEATDGGVFDVPAIVITNCQRAMRIINNGSISAEGCELREFSDFGCYILFAGSINVRNSIISDCGSALINNYGGDFNAENIQISNVTGVGAIAESNGSIYLENATLDNCDTAIAVALGGFIQARGVTVTNTTAVVLQALNDGFISAESISIDSTNTNSILIEADGTGRILVDEPGTENITTVTSDQVRPLWNTVSRGNAYIGMMDGTAARSKLWGQVVINDDSVEILDLGQSVTACMLEFTTNSASAGKGLFACRAASGPYMISLAENGSVDTTTGPLTGTTGTDGVITVSADDQTVYIENRSGGDLTFFIRVSQGVADYFW
jgi:hypothetical protein